MTKDTKKQTLESTFKSMDTEEWLDIHFTRPIGLMWANFFNRFDVHPNTVTIISIFLGAAAGILMYWNEPLCACLAVALLMWANFYDSADGQLARMTGKKTRLGRILDGAAGDVWFITIYAAICLRLMPQTAPWGGTWGVWIWALGAVDGLICHVRQAQLADYYRNVHLFFLKGRSGSELDSHQKAVEYYQQLSWKREFLSKGFQWFYLGHTRNQEQMTPKFQRLFSAIRQKYGEEGIPQSLRDDFRRGSKPLMKWTNILTFNCRAITIYILLLVSAFTQHPQDWLNDLMWLYFVLEMIFFNAIWWHMHRQHEKLSETLYNQLNEYE